MDIRAILAPVVIFGGIVFVVGLVRFLANDKWPVGDPNC